MLRSRTCSKLLAVTVGLTSRHAGTRPQCLLNALGGMNWLWFSAIALDSKFHHGYLEHCIQHSWFDTAAEAFDASINRVNWLSNSVNLIYLPVSFLVPWTVRRFGTRNTVNTPLIRATHELTNHSSQTWLAAAAFLVGAWLRYCGTIKGMTNNGAYATLLLGQVRAC